MKDGSDVDLSSPISCLPDDFVLEIFHNKVMDFKTLCVCEAVSKRFYAIVRQVHTIRVFRSIKKSEWLKSISTFKKVKSVCIHHTIPCFTNDVHLSKWKVKLGSNKIDYFVVVSPTSIYDNKGLLLYEEKHNVDKFSIAKSCLVDALLIVSLLWCIMNQDFPLLENVTIVDSENKGRVSVNGREKIDELRNWKYISSFVPRVSECYVPLLKLPVSGYVMKGVTLVLVESKDIPDDGNYDRFTNDQEMDYDKHDKEEAAYHEAMMEIFKKHMGSIVRRPLDDELEARISSLITALQCFVKFSILFSKEG